MTRKRFLVCLLLALMLLWLEGCANYKSKQIRDGVRDELKHEEILYAEEAVRTA